MPEPPAGRWAHDPAGLPEPRDEGSGGGDRARGAAATRAALAKPYGGPACVGTVRRAARGLSPAIRRGREPRPGTTMAPRRSGPLNPDPGKPREKTMIDKPVYLTQAGYQRLHHELQALRDVQRPAVAQRVRRAKEFADAMDTADYDDARQDQAFVERRIRELERQ